MYLRLICVVDVAVDCMCDSEIAFDVDVGVACWCAIVCGVPYLSLRCNVLI